MSTATELAERACVRSARSGAFLLGGNSGCRGVPIGDAVAESDIIDNGDPPPSDDDDSMPPAAGARKTSPLGPTAS